MPGLVSSIQDIIKCFQKYSEKDCHQNKLNSEELNLLIQNEFADVIKKSKDPNTISSLLAILDENNDGEVDFSEFCDLLCKVLKAYYKVVYEKEDTCQQPDEPKKNVETTSQTTSQTPDEPPKKNVETTSQTTSQKPDEPPKKNVETSSQATSQKPDEPPKKNVETSCQATSQTPNEPPKKNVETTSQTTSQKPDEPPKNNVETSCQATSQTPNEPPKKNVETTSETTSQKPDEPPNYYQKPLLPKCEKTQSTYHDQKGACAVQGIGGEKNQICTQTDQKTEEKDSTGSQSQDYSQGKDQTSQQDPKESQCQGKEQTSHVDTTVSQSHSDSNKDQVQGTTSSQSTNDKQDQTSKPTTTGKEQIMMAENTTTADQPGFYQRPLYIPPPQSFGVEVQASSQPPSYSQTQQDPTPTCQETPKEPQQPQQNKFYQHQQTFSFDKKKP
ncbi:cornulin-like isoform X1 [Bufo gargarizans]|uniref:cornulin-like isoform X1 n=1 Tax=Bufo gargarizans TaxID=30331 RepID=UPI001CF557CC|nr:cornulin-like isoform X1 [Bufo gargarizans]